MNIGLIGYGRMGKEIEKIAEERNHTIAFALNTTPLPKDFSRVDVAIEFTLPEFAPKNIIQCIDNKIPVVSGTTGWLSEYSKIVAYCKKKKSAFLYASNYSIGVNIFFELNKKLAELMKNVEGYQAEVEEIHHTKKLDTPSGTAISLANQIIESKLYDRWSLCDESRDKQAESLPIYAKREEHVPGTHTISYHSNIDKIHIRHEAFSRKGFAFGAVLAAEWILGKQGVFSMKEVLNLG